MTPAEVTPWSATPTQEVNLSHTAGRVASIPCRVDGQPVTAGRSA